MNAPLATARCLACLCVIALVAGCTPMPHLHAAAANGDVETIRRELGRGATVDAVYTDVDKHGLQGVTSLMLAAAYNHPEAARALLAAGAAVDARQPPLQSTALWFAAFHSAPEVAELLIESGASVNVADDQSRTPLYVASQGGCRQIVALLLANGADPNIRSSLGDSAIWVASGPDRERIAQILADAGADLSFRDNLGRSVLLAAADRCNATLARLAMAAGLSPDEVQWIGGGSPRSFAQYRNCPDLFAAIADPPPSALAPAP